MPKINKKDEEQKLCLYQNHLLKKTITKQAQLIKAQKKEIIRLNQKFILYFQFESEYSDSSDDGTIYRR